MICFPKKKGWNFTETSPDDFRGVSCSLLGVSSFSPWVDFGKTRPTQSSFQLKILKKTFNHLKTNSSPLKIGQNGSQKGETTPRFPSIHFSGTDWLLVSGGVAGKSIGGAKLLRLTASVTLESACSNGFHWMHQTRLRQRQRGKQVLRVLLPLLPHTLPACSWLRAALCYCIWLHVWDGRSSRKRIKIKVKVRFWPRLSIWQSCWITQNLDLELVAHALWPDLAHASSVELTSYFFFCRDLTCATKDRKFMEVSLNGGTPKSSICS